ncbi:hypothetical protein [Pacificispira sp.]|uniref:hypothetical protein n=1 Tax=Pacificispira sp. TaxID=2888761 RepID=UPI003BAD2048
MTITTTATRIAYSATGGATYSVPFEFFDDSDLDVFVAGTQQTLTTHYTVSGGDGSNGSITFTSGNIPTAATAIVIALDLPLKRDTDYQQSGPYLADTVNLDHDRAWVAIKQLSEGLERAIQVPITDGSSGYDWPTPTASTVIGWNSAGTALENVTLASIGSAIFPGSSTDNAVPRFDGTGGQSFQGSGVTISDGDDLTVPGVIADAVFTSNDSVGTSSRLNFISWNSNFGPIIRATGASNSGLNFDSNGTGPFRWTHSNGVTTLATLNATGLTLTGNLTAKTGYIPFTTDNDGTLDMSAAQNFKVTPSGNVTLQFSNEVNGQSGWIILDNSGGHTISLGAEVKVPGGSLSLGTGTHILSYVSDGTSVYVTAATEVS